jgi:transposase
MERRKLTREFKLEAVNLIKERGVAVSQASLDLGVHQTQLRQWVKEFAGDPRHSFPGHGQMKPELAEIARLRREVTKLKAERDILKKAAASCRLCLNLGRRSQTLTRFVAKPLSMKIASKGKVRDLSLPTATPVLLPYTGDKRRVSPRTRLLVPQQKRADYDCCSRHMPDLSELRHP